MDDTGRAITIWCFLVAFLNSRVLVALLLTAIIAPARPPTSEKAVAQERGVAVEMIAAFDLFFLDFGYWSMHSNYRTLFCKVSVVFYWLF